MTRLWRSVLALLLCGAGAVLGPSPLATAAPAAEAGFGTVLADLGTAQNYLSQPGFSFDGAYYAYLVPAADRCDLRLFDVRARRAVGLAHAHVVCAGYPRWAAQADTLYWQVNAAAGDVTAYAWDADPGLVTVLAPDAHVFSTLGVSADGRYLAFTGRSDTHPAPSVDAPRYAGFVYDRAAGVSLPLSKPDLHVAFGEWGPTGDRFTATTGGRALYDQDGACLGSGSSCRVFTDRYPSFGIGWSRDGTAVLGGSSAETVVYDFTDRSFTPFPSGPGHVFWSEFVGAGADRLIGNLDGGGAVVWDRTTGKTTDVSGPGYPEPSPTGRHLLVRDTQPDAYRYRNLGTGASAAATYRGPDYFDGYWTRDGSAYLGVGPGDCSSLRQWSPATNTVSLFGPPRPRYCYHAQGTSEASSSASGRFAVVQQKLPRATDAGDDYLVDLRRHVLVGPLPGYVKAFSPAGPDVLVFAQLAENRTERLLLVDPTPAPDVDDKPRWSPATPATGSRVDGTAGEQVHVQLGASEAQQAPVNLYFRWRTSTGVPVASAPKGWSCDRRRLAAGATVADCTFAPPEDPTDVRFLDVWAVNHATGAQSDTRSYRVGTR